MFFKYLSNIISIIFEGVIYLKKSVKKRKTLGRSFGKTKLFLIALLITMQIAIIVFFNTRYAIIAQGFSTFSAVISFFTCVYILSTNRNGLSKAVWIIFLLTCFTFGYVFFWISDERIFLINTKKRYKAVYNQEENLFLDAKQPNKILGTSKLISNFLYSSGKFLTYTGCEQEYFNGGESFFNQLIKSIKKAKEFIFLEFYIIAEGKLLDKLLNILYQKVSQGIEVRIIYDDFGSKKGFSKKAKNKMLGLGIKLLPFNKLRPVISATLNFRDHRKIVVIDGKEAFLGGCNLADEYVNILTTCGVWKDSGIRIKGSAVNAFTLFFLRQWEVLSNEREDYFPFLNHSKDYSNTSAVIPFADGLEYEHPIARGAYETLISCAKDYLYIMTPYFVIDDAMKSLLVNKALSGVDVRIVLPGIPDKKFVYFVSRNNAEKLIEYGVKVYVPTDKFVHSKCLLTEEGLILGSINMDLRSFYQQFESGVFTDDIRLLEQVKLDFEKTFSSSKIISEKNRWRKNIFYRIFVGFMQLIAPFM